MRLDTGDQPNFFQDLGTQILRFVDDQHDLLVVRVLLDKEGVEHVEQLDLALIERLEAEFGQHRLQKLGRGQLGLRYDRENDVIVQLGQK